MHRIFFTVVEALTAAVFLIPAFLYLHKTQFKDWKTTISYLIFALYLSAVYAVVGLPNVTYIRFDSNINLRPFAYMFSDYGNSLLNVILFIPLGLFLPLFWDHFKIFGRTVLYGFCASLFIEFFQLFSFRATDVNDLITNTLGTVIGYCIARVLLKFLPGHTFSQNTKELYLIWCVTFAVMFFVQPFLADHVWTLLY